MTGITLSSAESTTKLLRSKTEDLSVIISTANELLDGNLSIYLPNKELFVFELLCDRISDFNSTAFKSWKFDKGTWILFERSWNILSESEEDIKIRNKIARRIRVVELLISIFQSDSSEEVVDYAINSITKVTDEVYVEIEDNSVINLMNAFITKASSSKNYNNWIRLVCKLFQLSQSNTGKNNKKFANKFFLECLPAILDFVEKNGDSTRTATALLEITSGLIFEKDFINSITSNLEILLKKGSKTITLNSISCLYQYFVDHLSKNIKLCEEIFKLITNTPDFNDVSEILLQILSSKNRTLSSDFFKSIYEKEVINKEAKHINWKLVTHLIDLDVNLALDHSIQLFSMIPVDCIDKQLSINIGSSLINSYVIAREFPEFISNIWFSAVEANEFWECDDFVDLVASKIDSISASHLKNILANLYTKTNSLPQVTSILKGLTTCKDEKISSVQDLVLSNLDTFKGASGYWKLRYYILCLYGEDMMLDGVFLFTIFKEFDQSKYYFDSLFRTIELSGVSIPEIEFQDKYLQFLKADKSETYFSLHRWIFVINTFFSISQISSYINNIFESLSLNDVLYYLSSEPDAFFEQNNIVSCLINFLISQIEKGEENCIQVINLIPIQCFDKSQKKKLLDSLLPISALGKIEIRLALLHLLEQVSYRSKLEVEYRSLVLIFDSTPTLSDKLSMDIVDKVWRSHIQRYSTTSESKAYIEETFKFLSKFLKKYPKDGKVHRELELALSVLLIGKDFNHLDSDFTKGFDNLLHQFIAVVDKLLHHNLKDNLDNYNVITWLLNSCFKILDRKSPISSNTVAMVGKIGPKVTTLKNNNSANALRIEVYNLISKLSNLNLKSAIFIITLFISLKEKYNLPIDQPLEIYINDFSKHEDFEALYKYTLFSIEDDKNKNINTLVPVLLAFMKALDKENGTKSVNYFVNSLSVFVTSRKFLNYDSKLKLLLTMKSCLSDKVWLFSQYALETVITIITCFAQDLKYENSPNSEELYIQLTQVMSHILLFHRFRLSSRNHIVIAACQSLMEPLHLRENNKFISTSSICASSYTRLVGNLCEPSNVKLKEDKQSLNTTSSLIRRSLRKFVPSLLFNYIFFNLKFNFDSKVNKELIEGIYKIFDVLSDLELQLINASLDAPGRSYFKTLYANYKDHGKWKEQ